MAWQPGKPLPKYISNKIGPEEEMAGWHSMAWVDPAFAPDLRIGVPPHESTSHHRGGKAGWAKTIDGMELFYGRETTVASTKYDPR